MSAGDEAALPPAHSFAGAVVRALRELGGSGAIGEINEHVVALAGLSEEQQAIPRGQGRTEVEYRLAWARTLAKHLGLVENSSRGIWALTSQGREVAEEEIEQLKREARQARARTRRAAREQDSRRKGADEPGDEEPDEDDAVFDDADTTGVDSEVDEEPLTPAEHLEGDAQGWKERLLVVLKEMDPASFERLCQRLLREAGFLDVRVLGGSRDGGIDGTGVYRISLISFPVFFQAKRYASTLTSPLVRDFRGAMAGRGDRGLLITTGAFTTDARAEATRDGAPPVDLIDGDALADLLRQYAIGVTTTTRTVEEVTIDNTYFTRL